MQKTSLLIIALVLSYSDAWVAQKISQIHHSRLFVGKAVENGDIPCWLNIYDDDCSMTSAASANFVAGNWIKSMPCGEGIEVGDQQLTI